MTRARGNVLFLILLAVVLFAALSYAVTSSMRGGGKNASSENAEAQAASLLSYFTQIDGAITRMTTTGGLKGEQIDFFNSNGPQMINANYTNPACTSAACRLMDPNGGGVSVLPINNYRRGKTNGTFILYRYAVPHVGTSADDLVLAMHGADTAVCKSLNQKFGVNDILYSVSAEESSATQMYVYAAPPNPFTNNGATFTNLPAVAALAGTWCSCHENTLAACENSVYRPTIYHVVVAR